MSCMLKIVWINCDSSCMKQYGILQGAMHWLPVKCHCFDLIESKNSSILGFALYLFPSYTNTLFKEAGQVFIQKILCWSWPFWSTVETHRPVKYVDVLLSVQQFLSRICSIKVVVSWLSTNASNIPLHSLQIKLFGLSNYSQTIHLSPDILHLTKQSHDNYIMLLIE